MTVQVDGARWADKPTEVVERIAPRFVRVEPRRRAAA